jgi:hypothetical protein
MRQPPEFFGEEDLDLVYIAKKLDEALAVEKLFDDAELDYLVEPDKYKGGVIFASERIGAFFYVALVKGASAREVLANAGYRYQKIEE